MKTRTIFSLIFIIYTIKLSPPKSWFKLFLLIYIRLIEAKKERKKVERWCRKLWLFVGTCKSSRGSFTLIGSRIVGARGMSLVTENSLSLITGSTCTIDCRSDLGCVTFSSFFLRFFLFMFFSTYTNDTICKLWMKFFVYRWWTYSFLFKSEDTKHLVQNYSGWVDFLRAITELLEYILRSCISSRFKLDSRR